MFNRSNVQFFCSSYINMRCPLWIYQTFADPTKIIVLVFETIGKEKVYAVPWIKRSGDSQGQLYVGWYDQSGVWLTQMLYDPSVISKLNLRYLGKCHPDFVCRKPGWVRKLFPSYSG